MGYGERPGPVMYGPPPAIKAEGLWAWLVPKQGWRSWIGDRAALGSVVVALALALGHAGGKVFAFELLTHFRIVYGVVALLCLGVMLWGRARRWAVFGGGVFIWTMAGIVPWYWPPHHSPEPNLRVALINVNVGNDRYEAVRSWLEGVDAHVVVIQEVDWRWLEALAPLHERYPHRLDAPQGDCFGMAIWSRLPLSETAVAREGAAGVPMLSAKTVVQQQLIQLLGVHPVPPVSPSAMSHRNESLDLAAQAAAASASPVILAGDLNCTIWSPIYRRLERASGLVNARRGHGLFVTWPNGRFFLPQLMPIDHVLHSPEIACVGVARSPFLGSDHRGMVFDFAVAAP